MVYTAFITFPFICFWSIPKVLGKQKEKQFLFYSTQPYGMLVIPISIATQAVKNCLNLNLNLPLEKALESWISDSPVY